MAKLDDLREKIGDLSIEALRRGGEPLLERVEQAHDRKIADMQASIDRSVHEFVRLFLAVLAGIALGWALISFFTG